MNISLYEMLHCLKLSTLKLNMLAAFSGIFWNFFFFFLVIGIEVEAYISTIDNELTF